MNLNIPDNIYQILEDRAKKQGASPEQYIISLLEQITVKITRESGNNLYTKEDKEKITLTLKDVADLYTKEDKEKIKDRLKSLGYID